MREYWLDPPEYSNPVCPVCDSECDELFFDLNHEIVGCDCCITSRDAIEYFEEQDELAKDYADEQRADAAWESRFDR